MSNQNIDYYQLLNVPRTAGSQDIKQAYDEKKQELENNKEEETKKTENNRKKLNEMLDEAVKNLMNSNLRQQYDDALQQSSMQVQSKPGNINSLAGLAKTGAQFVLDASGKDLTEVVDNLKQYANSKGGVLQENNKPLDETQQEKLELGGQLFQSNINESNNVLQASFPNSFSMNEFSNKMVQDKMLRPEPGKNAKSEVDEEKQQQLQQQQASTQDASASATKTQQDQEASANTSTGPGAIPKLMPPGTGAK